VGVAGTIAYRDEVVGVFVRFFVRHASTVLILVLRELANRPATPPTGTGLIYTKYISGKLAIKIKGQSGLDSLYKMRLS
jgi:hypothetical protein